MATGDKLVTVAQAAEYLGITPQGPTSTGSKLITMGQLKSAVDGSAPSGGEKFVTLSQLKRVQTVKIVSWADGTDEQIVAMVAAADAGKIDLTDYWSAGDTRTVHLSAMSASSVIVETHAAQDVQMVLTDPGHYTLTSGRPCNFVVLQKNCLNETGVMNQGVTDGGWDKCGRRTWCNSTYRNAIPSTLRPIFKQFKVRTATGTGSGSAESTDWFSLFSEKEIFGSTTNANSSAESQNTQLDYYKPSSSSTTNRVKRVNGTISSWWERSPHTMNSGYFCLVTYSGAKDWDGGGKRKGIAPFGCI